MVSNYQLNRRTLLKGLGGALGLSALGPILAGGLNSAGCASECEEKDLILPNSVPGTLCGIGEPLAWWQGNVNLEKVFSIESQLGVKRHRDWINLGITLDDPYTPNPEKKQWIDNIINTAENHGVEIMALDDGTFAKWLTGMDNPYSVPAWGTKSYNTFLERYRDSWATLSRTFPKLKLFEVNNEPNHLAYKHLDTSNVFERVLLFTDMLNYARQGIKGENPDARVIMGGLCSRGDSVAFLEEIYRCIKGEGKFADFRRYANSPNPDDYFDIAAWHPYIREEPGYCSFVKPNIDLHDVMDRNGDGAKPVFLTEYGFTEGDGLSPSTIAAYLEKSFKICTGNLPFIETLFWFRLFTDETSFCAEHPRECSFGIAHSPESSKPYILKLAAHTYSTLSKHSTVSME
ncbi:MAG: hypothetical protein ABH824_07670 [Nanoarchaeota archaeon]|nr:hypothetical protein [Nanoarchaeota archaeon]MBU1631641.1 hypothetical protein [Nanoarchaeota archaeon]MBU1875654.1 hypothetical protein [Nanoarchaeota archaeon]